MRMYDTWNIYYFGFSNVQYNIRDRLKKIILNCICICFTCTVDISVSNKYTDK